MLSKPFYEALPYSYVAIGSLGILILDQAFAQCLAVLLYLWGSRIYSLRSRNRRTDVKKRRKKGWIPGPLYEHIPAICFLSAILLSQHHSKLAPILALCLCSFALYIFFRRVGYRKHKIFAAKCM
ncbi:hypothetical protein AB4238_00880 [Shewanella sp. 10N.286.45.A1]|uniref:hypothetical protein n=1 Tax=Shewanella sp. 10N.286.45.A1 TaxID=3229694 RepID=UPI00354DE48E